MRKNNKLKCPCCECYTVDSEDEVIVDICPVCFWQYDVVAQENPSISIGANKISLNEAKENYKKIGVCKIEFKQHVREPFEEEM